MTSADYVIVMKHVKIAELKAKLSEYLRYVRSGRELTVLDRDKPIAKITPVSSGASLRVREPLGRYRGLQSVPLPRALRVDVDIVALLMEERQGDR